MRSSRILLRLLLSVFLVLLIFVFVRVFVFVPRSTVKLADITDIEYDPAVWGRHYPLEYQSYLKNKDMALSPTGFGGSEKHQKSDKEPEMLVNFKGMPFAKDYSEDRGHPYALDDLRETKRIGPSTPGSCMTCKTIHLRDIYKDMGASYAKAPLADLLPKLKYPIVCANCHHPQTLKLRVINPAFIEAMEKRGVDVTKASRAEMRTYVCAQCHAEYYFEPESKRVVFPWRKGLSPKDMYAYYKDMPDKFEADWIHPDSQAKMLKAQHPDYELFSLGVHAKSGVACADCHMPYMRDAGRKYSSHWVTSPMRSVKASCRVCHTQDETWLLSRVKAVQTSVFELQRIAGQTIARAHEAIGKAGQTAKVNKGDLERARELVRNAQWFWDYVSAENSMGFHNPDLALSTLGQAVDLAHQAIAAAGKAAGTSF